MQAAVTRGRRRSPSKDTVDLTDLPEAFGQEMVRIFGAARQGYLDALPIAAAILALEADGGATVECANEHFRFISEWDERMGDQRVEHVPILNSGPISSRLAAFLKSHDPAYQFETADGRSIGGRHFTVRFSRLRILTGQPARVLVSLIDRTAQVETERSLRSEMLRDSLTGLPNRFAFNEKVDAVLADPQFREATYAVLAVDMTRFSRVNE
jgi:predicted signal transduction protein with EAL and GGDEF domain